jgi:hypothetical protein
MSLSDDLAVSALAVFCLFSRGRVSAPDHLFQFFAAPWIRGREPSPLASKEVDQEQAVAAPRGHETQTKGPEATLATTPLALACVRSV